MLQQGTHREHSMQVSLVCDLDRNRLGYAFTYVVMLAFDFCTSSPQGESLASGDAAMAADQELCGAGR